MFPQSMLSKNKKNITFFHLKIIIFKAVKNCNILNRRVFVLNEYRAVVFTTSNEMFHIGMKLETIHKI